MVRSSDPVDKDVVVPFTSTTEKFATLVRLDANGNTLWSKQYKGHGEVTDIALLTDGSFALSGHRLVGTGFDGIISALVHV